MSNRLKFFLSHFSISIFVALCVIAVVFLCWYPAPLAQAVDVTHIFFMMLVIDIILGPVLGVIVYKDGKKTLKFDLSVIIALQITALIYGVYSIQQGRPAWLAYNVDRFELVRKNELINEHPEQALLQFQKPAWFKPQWVGVEFSNNKDQRNDEMFQEAFGGISIAQKPERYVAFAQALPQIKKRARSLNELEQFNDQKQVQKILEKYPEATGYVPLKANAVDMTVLVNKDTGEVVKIVDLRPWK